MTPELEQEYQAILDNPGGAFQNHAPDSAYIKAQADLIIHEPDAQRAAQMAYNLVSDINHAAVGKIACKALFDRDRVQNTNEAPQIAAAVGNDILRGQLSCKLEGASSLQLGAFARGQEGINGFNERYHDEVSPGHMQNIHEAVADLAVKYNALTPAPNVEAAISAQMAQDFIDLSTAQHYSNASLDYLASQKEIVLADESFNDQLIKATKSKHTPRQAPDGYVAPEPDAQLLQTEREILADNWTNNNNSLRKVGPAVATHQQNAISSVNKNWVTAAQVAQQTVSKYGQDTLSFPPTQPEKQQVADQVFTQENKNKVAAMHAQAEGRQANVPNLHLVQGSELDKEARHQQRTAMRAPEPQLQVNPAANGLNEGEASQSRFRSVRDALRGAASRVSDAASSLKNTIGDKLERKGGEQKLSEVAPDKVEIYKSLQDSVKELERIDKENSIDASLGDADAGQEFKEDATAQTIDKMKEEMAKMREQDPGLAQLDRSKVGQVVHSGVRDAAKSAGSRLKA